MRPIGRVRRSEALRSLVAISGVEAERHFLERVTSGGGFVAATVARRALDATDDGRS